MSDNENRRLRRFFWLTILLFLLYALPVVAEGVVDVDVILQKIPTSALIVEPRGGGGIDEVCVSLPKRITVTAVRNAAQGDEGWLLDASTVGRICAGRLDGIASRPLVLELDAPIEKSKFDVTIQGGGEVLFSGKGIRARQLELNDEVLDPAEVLSFPNELALHEVAMGTIRRPSAVPEGGTWTFSSGQGILRSSAATIAHVTI